MSRRDRLIAVTQICAVRSLQQVRAELQLAQAAATLTRLEADRDVAAEGLAEHERYWTQAISGPAVALSIAQSSARFVDRGEAELRRHHALVAGGKRDWQDAARHWSLASATLDVAEQLQSQAEKAWRRAREEAALAEASDRATRRPMARL